MAVEVTAEEALYLASEQRHEELVSILNSINNSLKTRRDTEVVDAISKQVGSISSLINLIKEISNPSVNVSTNQELVVSSLQELTSKMLLGMRALRDTMIKPPPEWDFTIERDFNGFIERVTATAK